MAITITVPANNNITVNETNQTVNVSTASSTVSVATTGVATTAFSALTDVNTTAPYTAGHFISVGSDSKLKVSNTLQARTNAARPIFEYYNSDAGTNSSIVLRKNYGSGAYTTGDGSGMRFELSDATRSGTEYAYLMAQYSATAPSFTLATSTDDGATSNNVLIANKDLVTVAGDLKVSGNTILDSSGAKAIDFTTNAAGDSIIKFDTDKAYGLTASNFVIDSRVEMNTSILTTTSVSPAVLDSYNIATTRSGKYIIQISCGSDHQTWEGMVIHDGTVAKITAYGDVRTSGVNLATISAAINTATSRLELKVTPTSTASTRFRAMKTLIYV